MKKFLLFNLFLFLIIISNAQDTTNTYISGCKIIEFHPQTDTILSKIMDCEGKYIELEVGSCEVKRLQLGGLFLGVRKVIIETEYGTKKGVFNTGEYPHGDVLFIHGPASVYVGKRVESKIDKILLNLCHWSSK